MKKIRELDITGKRLTNHSVCKTMVKKLQKGGISNVKIEAITGHRNGQSLQYYSEMDENEHAAISKVLCNSVNHQLRKLQ